MRPREIVGYPDPPGAHPRGMSQAKLAEAMTELLGTKWYAQTTGAAEKGQRAFTVEDLIGLSIALDLTLEQLTTAPPGETVDISPRDATVTPATVAATASVPTPTLEDRPIADLERATQAIVENVKAGNPPAKTTPKKRGKK
jgi:hypothetical protein